MLHVWFVCRGLYYVVFIPCQVPSGSHCTTQRLYIINVLRIWRSFNIVTYFITFYRRTKICITNGNSFVFTRSLITCFYHTEQYIGFHYLPRRLVRKVVVIVSLLLRLTLTFESRDCSAALIKAAMTFFLQWLTMTFTPSRKSLPTILFIKEWRNT